MATSGLCAQLRGNDEDADTAGDQLIVQSSDSALARRPGVSTTHDGQKFACSQWQRLDHGGAGPGLECEARSLQSAADERGSAAQIALDPESGRKCVGRDDVSAKIAHTPGPDETRRSARVDGPVSGLQTGDRRGLSSVRIQAERQLTGWTVCGTGSCRVRVVDEAGRATMWNCSPTLFGDMPFLWRRKRVVPSSACLAW